MKVGFVGPAGGNLEALHSAVSLLLDKLGAERAIYLGDDHAVDELATRLRQRLAGDHGEGDPFVRRAAALWKNASAHELETLLEDERQFELAARIHVIPEAPTRGVELLGDRVCLVVYDKALLDEDDIYNASLVVYGRAQKTEFHRFGPRCFFAPGPAVDGQFGLVEVEAAPQPTLSLVDRDGTKLWTETLAKVSAKVKVRKP